MDVKERPKVAWGVLLIMRWEDFATRSTRNILLSSRKKGGMVGQAGLEPATPRLSSACSNQLSYRPLVFAGLALVELRRLELLTSCLQSRRSTN